MDQQQQQQVAPNHDNHQQVCMNGVDANNENQPMNENLGLPLPAPRFQNNSLKPPRLAKPKSVPDIVGVQSTAAAVAAAAGGVGAAASASALNGKYR